MIISENIYPLLDTPAKTWFANMKKAMDKISEKLSADDRKGTANWVKLSPECSQFLDNISKDYNMTVQYVVSKVLGTETEVISITDSVLNTCDKY